MITATIEDANGNTVTNDNSTSVTFSQTGGTGTISGAGGAVTASSGVATKTVTGVLAGIGHRRRDQQPGLDAGHDRELHRRLRRRHPGRRLSAVGNLTSGATRVITATIEDTNGNTVTNDNSTSVTFSQTAGTGTISGAGGAVTASSGIATKTVTGVLAGTITVGATSSPVLTPVTTASFTVVFGAATQVVVSSAVGNLTSGATRVITATIEDANGNTVTNDNSTAVTFSQTSGTGTISGAGGAVTAASGIATKTITGVLAGTITVGATSSPVLTPVTTASFTVVAGAATTLVFTTQPVGAAGGVAFSTQPVVKVEDVNGNVVTGDNTTTVTLSIAGNPGGGTISGCASNPVTAASGVATFSGCKIDKPANGYTLSTSNNHSLTNPTSSSFNITPSADGSGTASISPASTVAGTTNNTEILTYTVGAGGISASGAVTLQVPANWTAPQKSSASAAGYTQANIAGGGYATANITISSQTITVTTPSALAAGDTVLIRYGDTSGGGPGSTADTTVGSATWTVQEKSTSGGSLTTISAGGGSPSVTVNPDVAAKFVVAGGSSMTAGGSNQLTITAKDQFGNTATGYTGDHTITFSGAGSSPSPVTQPTLSDKTGSDVNVGSGTTITFTNGVSTAGGLMKLYKAESASIIASAADGGSGSTPITTAAPDQLAVTVNAAAATKLDVTSVNGSSNPTETVGFSVAIRSEDPYGNFKAPTTATTITLTRATGTGSLGGGTTSGSLTTSSLTISGVKYDTAESGVSLTATASGGDSLTAATSSTFTVLALPTKLVITSINGGTNPGAGNPFSVVVQAQDNAGTPGGVTVDTLVTLSKNTGTGTFGGTLTGTILAGQNSVTISGVTYTKAESGVKLDATATSGDSLTTGTSAPFTVDPGTATQLVFTSSPGNTSGGTAFSTQPVVKVEDANGNIVTGDTTTQVTLAIGNNPSGGSLGGCTTNPITVSAGVATFAGCKVNKAGAGYTLTTTNNHSLTNNASSSFDITVGSPVALTFDPSFEPSNAAAGQSLGAVKIDVVDAGGNIVTTDSSNVTVAIKSGTGAVGALLSSTDTLTHAAVSGVATFGGLSIDKASSGYQLHATDGSLTADDSTSFNITVGALDHFAVTNTSSGAIGTQTAGTPFNIEVTAQDAGNNTVTSFTGTVDITSNRTCSAGCVQSGAFIGGVLASSSVTLTQSGANSTITATKHSGSETGASNSFTVNPDTAASLSLAATTTTPTAGVSDDLTITALDAFGNTATSYTGAQSLTFSGPATIGSHHPTVVDKDGNTVNFGTPTPIVFTNGVASVLAGANGAMTLYKAETASIVVSDGSINNGSGLSVTVSPAAADHLTITSSTANLASGATRGIAAEIRDAFGNLETADNATSVSFTKTAGTGTVAGLTTVTAVNGVATDTVTGVLAGSITLTAHSGSLTDDTTTFTITPGAADHLMITSSTANLASGTTRGITAQVRDTAGNLETADNSTSVSFTKTAGTGTVTGLTSVTAASGVATDTVTGVLAGSITLQAHATGLADDTTTFTVVAGTADHLTITSSTANLASGTTRGITAQVRDAAGNLETADNSTSVDFTKTAGTGTVTGLTSVTAASGVATDTVTGVLAGSITLQAHATGLTDDTTTFTVVAGAADHLTITSATGNLASGATRDITAQVRDAAGNLETADNSTSVDFTKTAGTGTVTGLTTTAAVNGVATDTVTGVLAGSITLQAHATGLTDDTTTFTVVAGAADHLTITSSTANLASGTTRGIAAQVRDAAGNLRTTDNSTSVDFTKTAGTGTVTGLTTTTAVNGVATDTVTGVLAGSITLTAHSGSLTDDTTTFTVVAGAADHLTITSATSNLASGATRDITAQVQGRRRQPRDR